jgi:carboxypeptidase Ss1
MNNPLGLIDPFGLECVYANGSYDSVNDPETAERVAKVLGLIPGAKVREADPVMWGEDFSRFLQKAAGTFFFLGSGNQSKGCIYPNHSSRFKADEDVLKLGAASLALLAVKFTDPKGP